MSRQRWSKTVVAVLAGFVMLGLASWAAAQDKKAEAPAPPPDPFQEFVKQTKQPLPWLKWGADLRMREVVTPNLLLDTEDRHFQRYRLRAGWTVTPVENLDFNFRLVYEPRHFCMPARTAETRDARYIDEWTMSEGIFDLLNVKYSKAFGLPLTVTVGRQEIMKGNGWLILDGTPLDGSRTIFFDAARATWDFKDAQTEVDLIYVHQHADSDWWIEPFCDKDFHNIEQNEQGAIVYVTNKSIPKTQLDGYFIYKHDNAEIGNEPGDVRAGNLAPWQTGSNADIYTFGGRVDGAMIDDHWKYRAEFAQQFGNKDFQDLCTFGFNSRLSYFVNDKLNNNFRVGYEYLSGDDSTTGKNEQFDPLWGRWPQYSELYVYTVALENRPGETTNMHRLGAGWSMNPCKPLELALDYHLLWADEKECYGNRPYFSNDDSFRGHLLTAWLRYKFTPQISGHLLGEFFFPGDFYSDNNNETGAFLRYELTFTW